MLYLPVGLHCFAEIEFGVTLNILKYIKSDSPNPQTRKSTCFLRKTPKIARHDEKLLIYKGVLGAYMDPGPGPRAPPGHPLQWAEISTNMVKAARQAMPLWVANAGRQAVPLTGPTYLG